jgi:hypothetical protein
MTGAELTCTLCGAHYDEAAARACRPACPLGRACGLLRCPRCGWETPPATRLTRWLAREQSGIVHPGLTAEPFDFDPEPALAEASGRGWVTAQPDRVALTGAGEARATGVTRRHRLAERLFDVVGVGEAAMEARDGPHRSHGRRRRPDRLHRLARSPPPRSSVRARLRGETEIAIDPDIADIFVVPC